MFNYKELLADIEKGCSLCSSEDSDMTREIMAGYKKEFCEVLDRAYNHMANLKEDASIDDWIMLNLYLDLSVIRLEKLIKKMRGNDGR